MHPKADPPHRGSSEADAPQRPRRPPASCDLSPPGSGAGAGSSGPLPLEGSGPGRPARGRGRGRSARAGSPRLPFLVPGKSSLRGLAASRSRARCRSALARGSAAGAAPPLGSPQCRARPCPPARRRSAPGPGRRHHVTRPEPEPGQVSRGEGWGRGRAGGAVCGTPQVGRAAARRRLRPGLRRPRLEAPGGGGLGLLRRPRPRPRPGLAARWPARRDGRGDRAERGPALRAEPWRFGQPRPGPVLPQLEAWVWKGVARWVVG